MLLEGDAAQVKDHGRLGLLLYAAEVVGTDAGRSDEFLDTEGFDLARRADEGPLLDAEATRDQALHLGGTTSDSL